MKFTDPSELQIHIAVVYRLKLDCRPGVRFWHIPNGGYRSPREAAKLKALGVIPGMPDLSFLWSDDVDGVKVPKNLFIELKKKGGRLSPAQAEFRDWCKHNNVPWFCAYNVEEAVDILRRFRVLPEEGEIWWNQPLMGIIA